MLSIYHSLPSDVFDIRLKLRRSHKSDLQRDAHAVAFVERLLIYFPVKEQISLWIAIDYRHIRGPTSTTASTADPTK